MAIFEEYTSLINNSLINIVGFFTILIFGLVIGRFLGKLTCKVLKEIEINEFLVKKFKILLNLDKITGKIVQFTIYLFSFLYALNTLGVPNQVFIYLVLIILAVFFIFIILEIKDYVYNYVIGLLFIEKKFLKIGQKIKIKKIEGLLVKITNTEIKIVADNGDVFFIPNVVLRKSLLFKKKTINKN